MARQYMTAEEFRPRPLGVRTEALMDDILLDEYLQMATEEVEGYCDRILASSYYEEIFRGDGSLTHLTEQYPIISVQSLVATSLNIDDVSLDITDLVTTTLNASAGRIELATNAAGITFFDPSKIYTLNYQAGYETIPFRVKQATALWCVELLGPDFWIGNEQGVDLVPMSSEQIIELLEKFKRWRL